MNVQPEHENPGSSADSPPDVTPDTGNPDDLVLVTDPYGLFVRVSETSKNYLGYKHTEMEGRLATDFIHRTDLPETRDETRLIRRYKKPRHFYCRYLAKNGNPVEMFWTGMWDEENRNFIFFGRMPVGKQKPPLVHRLDVLDGYQVSKGLFAFSLVLAWCFDLGNNSTYEVRRIVETLNGSTKNWVMLMSAYTCAAVACLVWKQRWFQFIISVISVMLWLWMGVVTLASPNYVAAAGIYEVMLGLGSIVVLYYRGRQI